MRLRHLVKFSHQALAHLLSYVAAGSLGALLKLVSGPLNSNIYYYFHFLARRGMDYVP